MLVGFFKKKKKSPSPESHVPETSSDPPIGSGWDSERDSNSALGLLYEHGILTIYENLLL